MTARRSGSARRRQHLAADHPLDARLLDHGHGVGGAVRRGIAALVGAIAAATADFLDDALVRWYFLRFLLDHQYGARLHAAAGGFPDRVVLAALARARAGCLVALAGAGQTEIFALAGVDVLRLFLHLTNQPAHFFRAGPAAAAAAARCAGTKGRSPGNQGYDHAEKQKSFHGFIPSDNSRSGRSICPRAETRYRDAGRATRWRRQQQVVTSASDERPSGFNYRRNYRRSCCNPQIP